MTKIGLVYSAVAVALLASRAAGAQQQFVGQPDSPQWLKDRRYNEGVGIRTGDLELHPGLAGEVGYDSNYMLRSTLQGVDNGPPTAPVVPSMEFRITPSLRIATLGVQRREGDAVAMPPSVAFRAGLSATYREFIGLSNNTSQQSDITQQRNVSGAADARLDILPLRPWGAAVFADYARVIQPSSYTANPNLSFNSDNVGGGGEIIARPGKGTLDWHLGYQVHDTIFEQAQGTPFSNLSQEGFTRGRWRFRPRTALLYDATLRFLQYQNSGQAQQEGLVNSTPVRARIGLNGLITERFAVLLLAGWGASFYQNIIPQQKQYDSVIGQAEIKWFLSASPGIDQASDLTLALSSIALGYSRDFENSYLGNFYGSDRGYLKFNYFFAGRALVTLEGGLGAIEYPDMYWVQTPAVLRHSGFTDMRADATLFGEYRLVPTFGIDATLRYTANISNTHDIPEIPGCSPGSAAASCAMPGGGLSGKYDMSWNRFEAFLGVRWFM